MTRKKDVLVPRRSPNSATHLGVHDWTRFFTDLGLSGAVSAFSLSSNSQAGTQEVSVTFVPAHERAVKVRLRRA